MLISGLAGFVISLTPLANVLLGWQGSGGDGAAEVYVIQAFINALKR